MALREEESKYSTQKLLMVGIPSFVAAVLISTITHNLAHIITKKLVTSMEINSIEYYIGGENIHFHHPYVSAAGPIWTFALALISFGFFLRYPQNLFAASMAFVNASSRTVDSVPVFIQLLLHSKTTIVTDESISLAILRFKDPTISIVMMCFFSIITLYLTVIIIHDLKIVPWKWLVALVLLILLMPLQSIIFEFLSLNTF